MAHPLIVKATARVAVLAEELLANEETLTVAFVEVQNLAEELGVNLAVMVGLVKNAGLTVGPREVPKAVRGFTTSSNDRYFGPGACKSHGGSGWEQINGFAGQKG